MSYSVPMAMLLQKMAATVSCVMDRAERVCTFNQALYLYGLCTENIRTASTTARVMCEKMLVILGLMFVVVLNYIV